jgi:ribosome-associated heat shock protein Hsp15
LPDAGYENVDVRIDKWLWAARFFKTRSLASHACELGRVEYNGQPCKPAHEVRAGDMLKVKNDGGEFQIEVLGISATRGPASVAQALYRETDASRELRVRMAEERKAAPRFDPLWDDGRPSKRDRRRIDRFRGRT